MHAFVSFFVYRSMSYRVLCVVLSPFEDRSGEQGQVSFFSPGCVSLVACVFVCVEPEGGEGEGWGGGREVEGILNRQGTYVAYPRPSPNKLVSRVTRRSVIKESNVSSLFLGQRHHRPKTAAFLAHEEGTVELGAGASDVRGRRGGRGGEGGGTRLVSIWWAL